MEVTLHTKLKSGLEFNHLFPKAHFTEVTEKKRAQVMDTVRFIGKVVKQTRWQVERFVKQELKNLPLEAACKKLWHFVKDHIGYKKDEEGIEQIRSPRRLWWDRIGDCDCYTVFITACLSLLNGKKKIINRIAKYKRAFFQHIYPVVITPDGREIIMDCVTDAYNYEEPYTEIKDFNMDLNYLDGVPMKNNQDAQLSEETGDLGKLLDFLKKKPATTTSTSAPAPKKESKLKTVLKKTLNVVNKINPATVLLRAGVLAAMKLNFLKVAQRLKYGYLPEAEAKKRGADMTKYAKLKTIKDKMEKIFYGAGGKPENLREAILTGKGNEKREVPLSGFYSDSSIMGMDTNTPLTQVIGQETYYNEFMMNGSEVSGLGELGEPATAAAIAAASGVMATIAALLKNLGNLFPNRNKESADFSEVADANAEMEKLNTTAPPVDLDKVAQDVQQETYSNTRSAETAPEEFVQEETTYDTTTTNENTPASNSGGSSTNNAQTKSGDAKPPADQTWWDKNKSWLKPSMWAAGIASLLGLGYAILKPKKEKKPVTVGALKGLSAKPKRKKKTSKKSASKITTIKLT